MWKYFNYFKCINSDVSSTVIEPKKTESSRPINIIIPENGNYSIEIKKHDKNIICNSNDLPIFTRPKSAKLIFKNYV